MIVSLFLLLTEFISGYFFLGGFHFSLKDQALMVPSGLLLVAVVLSVQIALVRWMTQEKDLSKAVRGVVYTHLPWLMGLAWPWVESMNLPDPHNFTNRKIQILLGLILMTHLFLLVRLHLSGSYKKGWKNSKIFGVIAALLFSGVTVWTATVCDLSGDEPHYLLMAYSLIHDGDLDLSNNYANHDYEKFYQRGVLEPQGLEHVVEGKRYSHHPLGPVLLVLPGFALAGRLGAALTMALLAALALFLTLKVLEETGAEGWALHATGIIGLLSSPLLLFSGLIFPEIPTACLVAFSLLLFVKKRWFGLGLSMGLMLWMHNRNILIFIPFLLFVGLEILKDKKDRTSQGVQLILGLGIPLVLLVLYFYLLYGVLTPLGAHNEPFTSLFRLSHFWDGFLGLLMDQECGLLFHFPIFGLVITGGLLEWRSKNALGPLAVRVLLFFYLFMSFYENLGLTPATRYWVGVTPLLLLAVYPAIKRMNKEDAWKKLAYLSLAFGVFINWILAAIPWLRYNKLNGENWILKIIGNIVHIPLTAMNPAFQTPVVETKTYFMSALTIGVTVLLNIWFLKEKTEDRRK